MESDDAKAQGEVVDPSVILAIATIRSEDATSKERVEANKLVDDWIDEDIRKKYKRERFFNKMLSDLGDTEGELPAEGRQGNTNALSPTSTGTGLPSSPKAPKDLRTKIE